VMDKDKRQSRMTPTKYCRFRCVYSLQAPDTDPEV
jgi:hypothetical protein